VLVIFVVCSFLLPNPFFHVWGYIAVIGAGVFILFQLLLIVDFAHSWSNSWCAKMEDDGESKFWFWMLMGFTALFYIATIGGSIAMYVLFNGCGRNVIFVTLNLIAVVGYTFMSIHPKLQEANNFRSGLLQAGIVAAFSTYMVFSSIMSEPASMTCNPFARDSGSGGNTTSLVIGALFTILTVCYSAFSASQSGEVIATSGDDEKGKLLKPEGTTASNDSDEVEEVPSGAPVYSYSFFHLAFACGALYVCMLLTSWQIVDVNVASGAAVDSGIVSSWVKIVGSWLTTVLYIWTIVAPALLPDREWK